MQTVPLTESTLPASASGYAAALSPASSLSKPCIIAVPGRTPEVRRIILLTFETDYSYSFLFGNTIFTISQSLIYLIFTFADLYNRLLY